MRFIEGCNKLEVRIGEEGKESVIDKAEGVTDDNYLKVLDAISKLEHVDEMEGVIIPKELETLDPVKDARTKFETFKEIKNTAQLKAFGASKTAFLGEFKDGGKYGADTIDALKSSEECDNLLNELRTAFGEIENLNKGLGENAVDIKDLKTEVGKVKQSINDKKDEIKKDQNEGLE